MRLLLPALLVSALAAAAQQQSGPLVPARFDCTIDGTVVDRITHQPVPRAKLSLQWPRGNRSGAADNSGRWSFTGVACALVTIRATRFGYLDSGVIGSPPLNFLLSPDSPAHLSIELTPQSVISGKVVDENSDPVMAVRVVPYIARVVDGRRVMRNAPQTVTDDRGEFRIPRLEPGRYIVCALPGGVAAEYDEACYPVSLDAGPASALRLAPGDESHMEFNLSRIQPVRVSGVITGIPAGAHAMVELAKAAGAAFQPGAAVSPAPDGKFTILNVTPGAYTLTALVTQQGPAPFGRMPLEVGPAGADNIVLAVEPPIAISGTLRIDTQDPSPPSLSNVQVSLHSTEPFSRLGMLEWDDDHTSFTIKGVGPGEYSLVVSSPEFYVKSATLGGRDILHRDFSIAAAPGPMEIVVADNGGSLEGDVTLDDGSPAENASVILLRDGEFVRNFPVQNGHFNVHHLAPGDYAAWAWDSVSGIEYRNPDWMRQYAGAGATISVQAGQNAQIKLVRQTAPPDY
jgi:hypothetical protein